MDSEIIDAVSEWETTSISDGYAGLHTLADREFTGAVTEGSAWAFMLNGKVVGVFDGGIEAFEAADTTAYDAPDPALPLLYTMKATGGETRAKYYSNDTPLSSADATLSSKSFTGYIELSENVLSGDYYVIYYGGKSMSVAFVGNNRTLLSGDDAFDRANEEVGIYEVKEVDIDIVDVPEPVADAVAAPDTGPSADADSRTDDTPVDAEETTPETTVDAQDYPDDGSADGSDHDRPKPRAEKDETAADDASSSRAGDDVFSEEAEWREGTAIPALDPKDSGTVERDPDRTAESTASQRTSVSQRQRKRRRQQSYERSATGEQSESRQTDTAQKEAATNEKRKAKAEQEHIRTERDESREEVTRLLSRVSDLEAEIERLEAELGEARAGASTEQTETMTADTALHGTNLFVRYGTKSGGTLEKAHAGKIDREEVNENLQLEHHTGFETDDVVVDDVPYETFLHESIEYGFVRWVVEDLLYEIRDTGNQGSLDELFDAIPKIDRAELHGSVTLKYTESGEEHREQRSFDVVLRDRMGNPLLVANLNGSREPATEEMMTSLVENARLLRETNDSLGGAFFVTASFFEPEALETAADATGGGLLGRGRKKSYVKLSRKQGFHLCLVETRNGNFHVNVPEL